MAITYSGTRPSPFVAAAVQEFQSYELTAFKGLEIAKPFMSMVDKGTLPVVTRESQAGTGDGKTRRAPGSAYNRDDIEAEGIAFQCLGYGHETPLPDEEVAQYKSEFDAQVIAGVRNRQRILTDLETKIKDMVFNTTTFTGSALFTDYSGAPWDAAGSDVLGQVNSAIDKVISNGGMPNTVVIPRLQSKNLQTNTAIKAMLAGLAYPTLDQVAEVLKAYWKIPNIVFAGAVYNSANKGQTASMTDIWGDDYAMICRTAMNSNDPSESCAFRTPMWQEMSGADVSAFTYREEQTDSTIVKGKMFYDELVVDKYQGHLLQIDA